MTSHTYGCPDHEMCEMCLYYSKRITFFFVFCNAPFQINEMTTFSWSTRIKGFCILFVVGILLTFLGCFALFLKRGLNTFAIFYTLGNIVSLLSTCFLMGPFKQLQNMFHSKRIIATIIVLVSICLTLVAALVVSGDLIALRSRIHLIRILLQLHKAMLALIFIIIQSLAMTWYSLSYIPYARDAVKKMAETICV